MTTQGIGLVAFNVEGAALTVRDEMTGSSCVFATGEEVDPYRVSTDRFLFPVDAAVSFETDSLELPANAGVYVRSEDGDVLGFPSESPTRYPTGTYYVEVDSYCKLYLKVFDAALETTMERHHGTGAATLSFDGPTRVALGARSRHRTPAATITVPDDPGALREALPYLASSVKEWSCERSWPTLRGHPPRIERGDELDIPTHLSKPETGVTIAVPETYDALYTVAPLAYYLGADVVPGESPELHLANGFVEPLNGSETSLTERSRRLLSRCLFLDSLVRVGGYYSLERQEYEAVAGELPFYPPELYDSSIPEQLMEYLEVDGRVLEDYRLHWTYDAVLRDDADDAPLLPHLLDFPAPIRVDDDASPASAVCTGQSGGAIPNGATRLSAAAFEHSLDNPPEEVADARVALLGADGDATDALSAVLLGDQHREVREPFDLVTDDPTQDAVRRAIEGDSDFVHVGAPVTEAGIACADSVLDPATLTDVEARTVSLTGPLAEAGPVLDSLVERGARAGVVAEAMPARALGQVVGRVLSGAPLVHAVRWSEFDAERVAHRFAGNASVAVVSREGTVGIKEFRVESREPDGHRLRVAAWGGSIAGRMGGTSAVELPYVTNEYRLSGQYVAQPGLLSSEEVAELFNDRDGVYVLNGEVDQHEEAMTPEAVRESARRALADIERSEQVD
ncbi:hypothetical protein [Halarchaeum sp. P4]|uniref:hypothetical protein n=1 Tax=Halarchaeum sp. P4 TaxID=3421639 RepID=UPI003EBB777E